MNRNLTCLKLFTVILGLFISSVANAQVIDKINTSTAKARKANSTVNGATSTITDTKNTVNQAKDIIGGLFKKKKKKGDGKDSVVTVVTINSITITNIDYNTLKEFEDSLQVIEGVKTTRKAFNSSASIIEVGFTGATDELWDLIPDKLKNLFELKALADKRISLEFRKPS